MEKAFSIFALRLSWHFCIVLGLREQWRVYTHSPGRVSGEDFLAKKVRMYDHERADGQMQATAICWPRNRELSVHASKLCSDGCSRDGPSCALARRGDWLPSVPIRHSVVLPSRAEYISY